MRLFSKLLIGSVLALASATAVFAEPVTIRFNTYAADLRIAGINKIIAAFEAANPDIKITLERDTWAQHWEKKLAETASGTLPDVWEFVPGFGAKWMASGQLLDLKPYIDEDPTIDMADFDQGMIDYFRKDGGIYGLPYDRSGLAVFYNKDLFDKAKVAYPKAGWTYKDFSAAAEALTKLSSANDKIYGVSTPPDSSALWGWDGIYHGFGAALIGANGKMQVNNDGGKAALQTYASLVSAGYIPKPEPGVEDTATDTLFYGGHAGMQISGGWSIASIAQAKMNAGVVPLPDGPNGPSGVKLGGAFVVSKSTANPEAAYKFIAFLTGSQGLTWYITEQHAGVPARQSSASTLDALTLSYVDAISQYKAINTVENSFSVFDAQRPLYEQMWTGSLTPAQVAEQLQAQGDRLLQ